MNNTTGNNLKIENPSSQIPEKPPLFDVVSEPGQSAQKNATFSIDFSIVVSILLILIIIIIARKAATYFITKKLKEEMNTSTKK